MFFKPIKYDQIVVSPPNEVKKEAEKIFDRILHNYNENYQKFKVNPEANVLKDPWFRREAWRWDPFFSKQNILRHSFPGLKVAAVAFSIYFLYDLINGGKEEKEHA